MAEARRTGRPLSPHLQIYRLPITAIVSILTRITGNGLIVGVVLVVWWLLAAATGPGYFAVADWVLRSWLGDLVLAASAWALWYHLLAGLRHLWFDSSRGLEVATAERSGIACLIGAFVLTALTIVLV
jgi:succinate dehydrogenase / fumarate reductase cytochrome b subunit